MQITRQNIQRLSSNNFYTVPTPLNGFTKKNVYLILLWFRSNRLYIFCKLGVPKNFAKFTEKYLCWSLFLKGLMTWNFIKKRIQHTYFPVNFEKFSRKTLFTDHTSGWLLVWLLRSNQRFMYWSRYFRFSFIFSFY